MIKEKVIVKNKSGIHARPASVFANAANKCKSSIKISYQGKIIEGKSILNIMAAAIKCGSEIEIWCDGETEQEDMRTMLQLIEDGLGES